MKNHCATQRRLSLLPSVKLEKLHREGPVAVCDDYLAVDETTDEQGRNPRSWWRRSSLTRRRPSAIRRAVATKAAAKIEVDFEYGFNNSKVVNVHDTSGQ